MRRSCVARCNLVRVPAMTAWCWALFAVHPGVLDADGAMAEMVACSAQVSPHPRLR